MLRCNRTARSWLLGVPGNYPAHYLALVRYSNNGDLDTSFGGGTGKVTTNFGSPCEGKAVMLQPDGKILVTGFIGAYPNYDVVLARYHSNGALDTTFGDGSGKATAGFGGSGNQKVSLALQSDGKIIVVGGSYNPGGNHDLALARFDSNGSLDTSFGNGTGRVTTNFGGDDYGHGVVLQPDGKIIAVGSSNTGTYYIALARYNSNGSLDPTFGSGSGMVTSPFGWGAAVVLQNDGKILVAGGYGDFILARYHSNGTLDTSFGNGTGRVATDFGADEGGDAVALQPDGKIVVAGHRYSSNRIEIALSRYNNDGSLDIGFGAGTGKALTYINNSNIPGDALALQPDGKIVVAGANGQFAVVRYLW